MSDEVTASANTTHIKTSDMEKSDVVNKHTGQKWVYSPIVKEHFFHPKNLLLEEPAEGQFDARGTVGSPACLIPTTQIVTKQGVREIKDIEVGELVLGADGAFHPVERLFKPTKEKKIVTIKTSVGELTCTVDHLIFGVGMLRGVSNSDDEIKQPLQFPRSWFHAADLQTGDFILYPIAGLPYNQQLFEKQTEFLCDDNFAYIPVRSVETSSTDEGRLHNFEVAESHTYCTDSFLVHNCGDVMDIWIKVDATTERVTDLKWKTFGCGSAIAATSMFSEMVTENGGATVADAMKIKPQDIMTRLGGLPNRKIHCSVLADKAFRKAVNNYFHATGQHSRVEVEGARVVDPRLNITDKDIEEAVLEGAQNLEDVQKKLKVGVGDPSAIPEIEQLIRFYSEKYYG